MPWERKTMSEYWEEFVHRVLVREKSKSKLCREYSTNSASAVLASRSYEETSSPLSVLPDSSIKSIISTSTSLHYDLPLLKWHQSCGRHSICLFYSFTLFEH